MSQDRWIWCCDRRIPSEVEAGRRVLEELFQQLQAHHWCGRDLFCVHLAVEEAIVNAIRHGNRLDPTKHLAVSFRLAPDLVRIEITDEGSGFDPATVADPTDPDQLHAPNGRGLMLIRAFMSRVEFSHSGRHVILEKQRSLAL